MNIIEAYKDPAWFNVMALCLNCHYKWIGSVEAKTSLFTLECPGCGADNSFASFLPDDYLDQLPEYEEADA